MTANKQFTTIHPEKNRRLLHTRIVFSRNAQKRKITGVIAPMSCVIAATGVSMYVSVELKLSVTTLRREAIKKNRQIAGIAKYPEKHTIPEKVAVFITLFDRNKNGFTAEVEIQRSVEKLHRHFGLIGIVHSLTGLTNPLPSRSRR